VHNLFNLTRASPSRASPGADAGAAIAMIISGFSLLYRFLFHQAKIVSGWPRGRNFGGVKNPSEAHPLESDPRTLLFIL